MTIFAILLGSTIAAAALSMWLWPGDRRSASGDPVHMTELDLAFQPHKPRAVDPDAEALNKVMAEVLGRDVPQD